ncbi:unnamed protein product [Oreochromis niloticus]|nr:unnamed protein product [Mustela putorius furo]
MVTAPTSTAPTSTAPASTINVTPTNSSSAVSLTNNTSSQLNSSFQESTSTTKSASTAPPITSKETSPTSNTSSIQPASQANSPPTQTSPPVTPPNTTVTATTKASQPPQCSYTVTNNNTSGLQIEINPPGNYTLTVFEEGRPQTGKEIQADHLKQIPVGKTGHLKPCTGYSLNVSFTETLSFNDTGKEIFCHSTNKLFRTDPMSKGDVKETSCIPGYVCYGSDWDISSSISTPNNLSVVQCTNDKKTSCVRPANEDICSDLTVTFTSGSCVNSSFNFTKSISVDFLNPSEIQQIKPTGLPAEITTTLPDLPKCKNLSVSNYTCSEKHKPDVVKLSELEPFTDYSCTGLILQNNITINKTTPSVQVRVDCDLTITNTKNDLTSTSIELSWTTTSKNCQQELPNLHKLSYDCICQKHGQKPATSPDGRTCVVTGLIPYTDYKCGVRAKYNNEIQVSTGGEVDVKTKIGNNNKAVTGFRVFLVILTSVALLFLTYKFYIQKLRKSTNDVNDDMELEAIYENGQTPGSRHKEAH